MTDDMTPDELRDIRVEKLDLTQRELAKNVGCSIALVKKQEGGSVPIIPKWRDRYRALNYASVIREPDAPAPKRGRPPGGANRPRDQGNGAWDDAWFITARPEIAAAAGAAAAASLSAELAKAMRSPWFWVAVAVIVAALILLWNKAGDWLGPNDNSNSQNPMDPAPA